MTALDTNVLARFILDDEPEQTPRAEVLVHAEPCLVCDTVLLELAWVLKSAGQMSATEVIARLRTLLDLPTIFVRDESAIRSALDDADAGMGIADAFHRALSPGAERLVTFDRPFATVAAGRPGLPVDLLG